MIPTLHGADSLCLVNCKKRQKAESSYGIKNKEQGRREKNRKYLISRSHMLNLFRVIRNREKYRARGWLGIWGLAAWTYHVSTLPPPQDAHRRHLHSDQVQSPRLVSAQRVPPPTLHIQCTPGRCLPGKGWERTCWKVWHLPQEGMNIHNPTSRFIHK